MAVKDNKDLPRRPLSDPAVDTAMGEGQEDLTDDPIYGGKARRAARLRNMTPAQRRKVERDMKRVKLTVDIAPDLKAHIEQASSQAGVPPADIVGLLVYLGLEAIEQGQINLGDYTYHSNLPRYPYRLIWGKEEGSDDET